MLREAENSGLFAAGFVSCEATPAFDSALETRYGDAHPKTVGLSWRKNQEVKL